MLMGEYMSLRIALNTVTGAVHLSLRIAYIVTGEYMSLRIAYG